MKLKFDKKMKIIAIFGALFLVILTLLLLIFNAGKKSYMVYFDLDGGTLLSGSVEQEVFHGQNAIPPKTVKDNAYFHSWSRSYERITKDVVIRAIWEYETTPGITYTDDEHQNFAEIERGYPYLQGEIYLGGYHDEKKVLGIREHAFYGCTGITKVYMLDGLLSIGNSAFESCTALSEIEIPETVVHLGDGVFKNCEKLETLVLNEGLLKIGAEAFFGCKSLTEMEIPQTVTSLGSGAFRGCELLEKITIYEGIEEISEGTFLGCKSLKSIEIPESVTKIGEGAFRGCKALETVILPEGLQSIDTNAFEGCTNLKTIILPQSLVNIAADAFAGCDNLQIFTNILEKDTPAGWKFGWNGSATSIWLPDDDEETLG